MVQCGLRRRLFYLDWLTRSIGGILNRCLRSGVEPYLFERDWRKSPHDLTNLDFPGAIVQMFFSSNASVLQSAASTDLKDGVRSTRGPRLCFISTMLGRRPGFVTSPGQILSDLFLREGYD